MNNSTVVLFIDHAPCSNVSTAFTAVLSIISLAAFIGNVLVIATFLKTPILRTSTNYYIVNMAVADLVCACFNWPLFVTEGMLNGRSLILEPFTVCKFGILMYVRAVSQAVSVLSMVLIAVDRFIAVVFPLNATMLYGRIRAIFLLLSWLIPLSFFCPYVHFTRIEVDHQIFCTLAWSWFRPEIFYVAVFFTFYIVPLIVIIILYTLIMRSLRGKPNDLIQGHALIARRQKQNKNIMRIFISIVSAFFICWTPLCVYVFLGMGNPSLFQFEIFPVLFGLFFYIFLSLSTAVNPVILFAGSRNYRVATKYLCSQACSFCKCVNVKKLRKGYEVL